MIVEKMMNTAIQGHTFTKKIGQTVYVVRYHFNEDAKETMQEKIKPDAGDRSEQNGSVMKIDRCNCRRSVILCE